MHVSNKACIYNTHACNHVYSTSHTRTSVVCAYACTYVHTCRMHACMHTCIAYMHTLHCMHTYTRTYIYAPVNWLASHYHQGFSHVDCCVFQVHGTLRVVLTELNSAWPFFGKMNVSFVTAPSLSFCLAKAASIFNVAGFR